MRRRGRGEGRIVQRADGRWMARADLGWSDGKRRRKTVYATTRRGAASKLATVLQQAKAGQAPADDRQTVGQFLSRWLTDVAKGSRAPANLGDVRICHFSPHHAAPRTDQAEAALRTAGAAVARSAGRRRGNAESQKVCTDRAAGRIEHGDPLEPDTQRCGPRGSTPHASTGNRPTHRAAVKAAAQGVSGPCTGGLCDRGAELRPAGR